MLIRAFAASDIGAVSAINAASVPEVGEATEAELAALAEMCSVALVAEDDDRSVVGFCMVLPPGTDYSSPNYLYFQDRYTDFVYLDRIAVAPGNRGTGIGTALHLAVQDASSAGIVALEVNVVPPNEASMAFHRRLGFVELERLETRPGKVVSLQILRRGAARSR